MTRTNERLLLGIDIGGTFTDLALVGMRSGSFWAGKVLTDYADLSRGVLEGVAKILAGQGFEGADLDRVIHGTTLVTNSLIERRGAKTALIVTRGFADLLEIARESRYDIYDIALDIPAPLVPRGLVFELDERLDYRGEVLRPLQRGELEALAMRLREMEIESIAICLLHSYVNPQHEQELKSVLRRLCPDAAISVSSEIVPDMREYERASTTVANAYVKPVVRQYLERVNRALARSGVKRDLSVVTSDGGIVSCAAASEFPVRLTESGPAGGALAAAFFGRRKGIPDLIAYDMGGTTAKICVIEGGMPAKATKFEFGRVYRFAKGSGLPLQVPVIEMIEIGAGGGSIARVNELGLLQVGPDSANASPGPACYGLGGALPTVSDADLFLGYLAEDFFLGGRMRLDRARAEEAIERHIARPLGVSLTRAAWGVHRVVNDNMARATKVHCLEQGKDPRRYVLFAYGGAGPVHAYGVARALGISKVLFPQRAGVMSALGFLVAEPSFEVVRGKVVALDTVDMPSLDKLLEDMKREALEWVKTVGAEVGNVEVSREAALRYEGQSYELNVPIPDGKISKPVLVRISNRFKDDYRERYHALTDETPIEVVRWRVRVTSRQTPHPLKLAKGGKKLASAIKGRRRVYVPENNDFVRCPVYDRYQLPLNARFPGPAVIEEIESTVFVGANSSIQVDRQGDLLVALSKSPHNRKITGTDA